MAQHNDLGKLGEKVAARYLIMQGYNVLAVDWRCGHKDLDLVVTKEGTTVFVEVKTRTTDFFGTPEEAVDNEKIHNLMAAAQAYMVRNDVIGPVRFDVIAIVGKEEPFQITHFVDAFNPLSVNFRRHLPNR